MPWQLLVIGNWVLGIWAYGIWAYGTHGNDKLGWPPNKNSLYATLQYTKITFIESVYILNSRLLWQLGIGNLGIQNNTMIFSSAHQTMDFQRAITNAQSNLYRISYIPCGIRSLPVLNCYDVYLHMRPNKLKQLQYLCTQNCWKLRKYRWLARKTLLSVTRWAKGEAHLSLFISLLVSFSSRAAFLATQTNNNKLLP